MFVGIFFPIQGCLLVSLFVVESSVGCLYHSLLISCCLPSNLILVPGKVTLLSCFVTGSLLCLY